MIKTVFKLSLLISLFISSACSLSDKQKNLAADHAIKLLQEAEKRDSWVIPTGKAQYPSVRNWDLLHQKIWIKLDFETESVHGTTEMKLASLRSGVDTVSIDAKKMMIKEVFLLKSGQFSPVSFSHSDSLKLHFLLSDKKDKGDTLIVKLVYEAKPKNRTGFNFVNAGKLDEQLPEQFWTLGQPEDNSYWLPTIDHPAERTTHELWLNVPAYHTTVSNGIQMMSTLDETGKRKTDYYTMSFTHAPYLIAIASSSDYHKTAEVHQNVVLEYYTDSAFASFHKPIFEPTKAVLDYMYTLTGKPYPYPIYRQAVVHQFTAKGMEHTMSSFLFDRVQIDEIAAKELSNQDLIVHELAHQWFGNYLGLDDWAHLGLNEGLARFAEWDFTRRTQGEFAAALKFDSYLQKYLMEARRVRKPVFFRNYGHPDELFDAHTYEKSGMAFIMLHELLGADRFGSMIKSIFSSASKGIYQPELFRKAAEQEWGRSLDWFFKQWWESAGHPQVEISSIPLESGLSVRIKQVQDQKRLPVFTIPIQLSLLDESGFEISKMVWMNSNDTTYVFNDKMYVDVIPAFQAQLLAEFEFLKQDDAMISHALKSKSDWNRYASLIEMDEIRSSEHYDIVKGMVSKDRHWQNRKRALQLMASFGEKPELDLLIGVTKFEKEGRVKIEAVYQASMDSTHQAYEILSSLSRDDSYFVAAEAISVLGKYEIEEDISFLFGVLKSSSYQNVLKNASIRALAHFIEHEEVVLQLLSIAQENTDASYRANAIKALLYASEQLSASHKQILDDIVFRVRNSRFSTCKKAIDEVLFIKNVSLN